jgi:DNA helicase HerA-like ATPase
LTHICRHDATAFTRLIVQRIVKEGRKYGIGAMIVSQRPSEVDETILSQCGTFFALRLSNPSDRAKVQGTLPDSLTGLMDMLPVLRTGEAIVTGEAAQLPLRCRISLPEREHRPDSEDPQVSIEWERNRIAENYGRVGASWRSQSPRFTSIRPKREAVTDTTPSEGSTDGS